jgi:glycosyltransferase involved in cell wall biosynthesis
MEKPNQLNQVNLDELRKICQEYVDFVDSDDEYYEDNNFDQYIFEKAMMALYGKDVFDWINERRD